MSGSAPTSRPSCTLQTPGQQSRNNRCSHGHVSTCLQNLHNQNEGPLPNIRPWTGVNAFSYFVAVIPMLRTVSINKTECCSKASHSAAPLMVSLLPYSQTSTCQWLPHFCLYPRQLPSSAYSHIQVPTKQCHLNVFYTSQMEQPCPRELCFPSCPVPHPPKHIPLWVNDTIHLPDCST